MSNGSILTEIKFKNLFNFSTNVIFYKCTFLQMYFSTNVIQIENFQWNLKVCLNVCLILQLEKQNLIIQLLFDFWVFKSFGFKSLAYLLIGTYLALGIHPISGHFIAEHYMFVKVRFGPYVWRILLRNVIFKQPGSLGENVDYANLSRV